ncbi:hypothetical protein HPP92_016872 [Vanilla planifolia]|uniref:Uncharacterized protein n=1 Tax=Vanilla planifolia TaxID=51239 RepID=A0A835QM00_VANPL|nr:hypothetical protein HPP92_016872 [Vanilla planifolia]
MRVLYLQHNYLTGMPISPATQIPSITSVCLQYNCMLPPVQTACPARADNRGPGRSSSVRGEALNDGSVGGEGHA